jgi:hypothetical protein
MFELFVAAPRRISDVRIGADNGSAAVEKMAAISLKAKLRQCTPVAFKGTAGVSGNTSCHAVSKIHNGPPQSSYIG